MKLKKLLVSIDICLVVLSIVALIIFSILGKKDRVGYLSNISLDINKTIKNNHLNVDNFIMNNKDIEKYIVTNNMITDYTYNFRISYYDKVFRNSDIYGVYIVEDSLPDYIKNIEYKEKGSPFGTLVSTKKLENEKIDNIIYFLIVKFSVFIKIIFLLIVLGIFIYFFMIDNFIKFLKRFDYKNEYFYRLTIFLCFLILPNIVYVIFYNKFDHTNYENRKLYSYPIFSLTEINEYPKLFENYFNDHLSFRNELVKLKNYIDIRIFNNFMSSDLLFAKDKWVLSKNVFLMNRNFFSIEELKQGAYNLLHFRDELKKRNIDFIFMVCPYSANIMVNMYPKYIKHIEYNSTDQFISYISKNTDLKIVYPKKQLLEYKDKYQLYYKYDHHWNNIGAYVGFKVLSDKLSMNLDKLSDLNVLSFDVSYRKYWVLNNNYDFYNTSVRTMNLHNLKYFRDDPIYYIEKYHIKTNYYFLEGRKHFHSPSITRSAVASNDYNVFFIDDSYAYGMFDYIATEFYKASFRHREEFKVEEIIKYDPNIVVFELVEGNLKKSVLDIIPNYKIEKINKNLETNSVVSNN